MGDFENASEKIKSFRNELKDLFDKYDFGTHESDNYNGMDEFCGTDLYFTVDGYIWYGETVEEMIKENIKK